MGVAEREHAGLRAIGEVGSVKADAVLGDGGRRQGIGCDVPLARLCLLARRGSRSIARLRVLVGLRARCRFSRVFVRPDLPLLERVLGQRA